MNWEDIAAYGYFFLTALLVFLLYGYIWHLYKSERTGRRDYEKYGNIALDDDITSEPLETYKKKKTKRGA